MRASYDDYHSLSIIYSLQSHVRVRTRVHTYTYVCTHMYKKPHFSLLFLLLLPTPAPIYCEFGSSGEQH